MKMIVGLGNPGTQYINTRHNVGFMVIDWLASDLATTCDKTKFNGLYGKGQVADCDFIIAKPLTFMNLSGDFVQAISSFYKIAIDDILVVYDEMDFVVGRAQMKKQGSAGGHNGMRDIINKLGTEAIPRMRIGIGRSSLINSADYVLSPFNKLENATLIKMREPIVAAIREFIIGDFAKAAQKINTENSVIF